MTSIIMHAAVTNVQGCW